MKKKTATISKAPKDMIPVNATIKPWKGPAKVNTVPAGYISKPRAANVMPPNAKAKNTTQKNKTKI